MLFFIGNDYTIYDKTSFFIPLRRINDEVFCPFCGEKAQVEVTRDNRQVFEDYFCTCPGAELYRNIQASVSELYSKYITKTDHSFKLKALEDSLEKLKNEAVITAREIERLRAES